MLSVGILRIGCYEPQVQSLASVTYPLFRNLGCETCERRHASL
jgi:hypothetical protein